MADLANCREHIKTNRLPYDFKNRGIENHEIYTFVIAHLKVLESGTFSLGAEVYCVEMR